MHKQPVFVRAMAIIGTVVVWFVLLAPVVLAALSRGLWDTWHVEWLLPAQAFPLALSGGLLLLWAAVRSRLQLGIIMGSLVGAVTAFVLAVGIAMLTGLAPGGPEGSLWRVAPVVLLLAAYVLALLGLGIGGIGLSRRLQRGDTGRLRGAALEY